MCVKERSQKLRCMRGSRNFHKGGGGVPPLIVQRGPMVYFKGNYNSLKLLGRGVQHFTRWSNFFQWGEGDVQFLIPMEALKNLSFCRDFRTPVPPLDPCIRCISVKTICVFFLSFQTLQILMKCCIMWHYIWVFTVCLSMHL